MSQQKLFKFIGMSQSRWLQILVVVAIWSFVVVEHQENDGLWFQGDSPRHAANGAFWREFLHSPTLDAREYALSYYARYPVIAPVAYPPVFYLAEAAAYEFFGVSPYVAKFVVQIFTLMVALYALAWLRRWQGPEAGLAAAALVLLPGMFRWSHAVMLNVPAVATSTAFLFHARCWLERSSDEKHSWHFFLAVMFVFVAIFTYYPNAVVVGVLLAWLLALGKWKAIVRPMPATAIAIVALVLVPVWFLLSDWAPVHMTHHLYSNSLLFDLESWSYYPRKLDRLFGSVMPAMAAIGLIVGATFRRYRRETIFLTAWLITVYLALTLLNAKSPRYFLVVSMPLVCLSVIALRQASRWIAAFVRRPALENVVLTSSICVLVAWQMTNARNIPLGSLDGVKEVVAFLEKVAPNDAILYDGYHGGVFTFYVQAGDPNFQRRVVRGDKLLYSFASPNWRRHDYVKSREDVVSTLRNRGGCRWIAVEHSDRSEVIEPMRLLREAVKGPDFELAASFPILARQFWRIDVYRLNGKLAARDEVELPFPKLGTDVSYRVKPVTRSRLEE